MKDAESQLAAEMKRKRVKMGNVKGTMKDKMRAMMKPAIQMPKAAAPPKSKLDPMMED